ncbi:MAG: helix-turn-helix transcriptional regulator [Aquabacterium sp.]|jgi:DNA-binding transcriptional regulator YiaG|nr:helix-turn-helix transcriptional regulator [Aquabacterium sp.]
MDGLRSALALTPCVFLVMRELITARTRAGLTQSELAERMHTTQSTIARLEENRGLSPIFWSVPYFPHSPRQ